VSVSYGGLSAMESVGYAAVGSAMSSLTEDKLLCLSAMGLVVAGLCVGCHQLARCVCGRKFE
jgi:hypothetical protein